MKLRSLFALITVICVLTLFSPTCNAQSDTLDPQPVQELRQWVSYDFDVGGVSVVIPIDVTISNGTIRKIIVGIPWSNYIDGRNVGESFPKWFKRIFKANPKKVYRTYKIR